MGLIDFILSVAAVLLWVAWRTARADAMARPRALTLISTLKQANPKPAPAWKLPLCLLILLIGRAVLYWRVGSAVDFTPKISLISVTLFFRSDYLAQMAVYSALSFGVALSLYYFTLILFSLLHPRSPGSHPLLGFVRSQLGWLERRHPVFKLLAPLLVTTGLWAACSPLLVWLQLLTAPESLLHALEQGLVIGLGAYSIWQVPLGLILFLHLVNSYVYLGKHPVWDLVDESARRILLPLRRLPLRLGRVDFAPVAGIALVFFLGHQLVSLLPALFKRLPL